MARRASALLVALLLAGCACRPCRPCPPCPSSPPGAAAPWTGAPPTVALPELTEWVPVPTPPAKAPPPTPADRLATASAAEDPLRALLALAREAPDVLRDAPDEAWAPFLSGRLRLVDLREVARDGGDAPRYAPGPDEGPMPDPPGPVDPRVERIAEAVRSALGPAAWDAGGTLLAVRRWGLVVVQSPERWIDVEKALDRVAVTGGPHARIAAVLVDDADALAKALGVEREGWTRGEAGRVPEVPGLEDPTSPPLPSWETATLDEAAWSRAEALAAAPPLRIPVSGDRRVAAGRTSRTAYVRDFDVEVPPGTTVVPMVGTLVAGATLRGWRAGDRWHADFVLGEVVQPIPTFETQLAGGGATVRIELPEVRLVRFGAALPPKAGSAVLVRGLGAQAKACLFRVEAQEDGTPPRPAWRWWKPAPTPSVRLGRRGEYGWPLAFRIEPVADAGGVSTPRAAPSLLLTEGEEGVITVQEEEAYVGGAGLARSGSPRYTDPVVGRLVTGLSVRARVQPQDDGSAVVEGRVRIEDRDRPMRTFTTIPGPAAPISLQLPRTWRTDIPFRVRLRPGETTEVPAAVRTALGLGHVRLRLSLGERVRLFTPWGRPAR